MNENITEKVNVETAVVADIQQAFLQITSQKLTEIFFNLYCFRTLIIQMLLKHVLLVLCLALRYRPFLLNATIRAHVEKHLQKNYFFNSYKIYMLTILLLLLTI